MQDVSDVPSAFGASAYTVRLHAGVENQGRDSSNEMSVASGGQDSRTKTSCDKKPICGNNRQKSAIPTFCARGLGLLDVPDRGAIGTYPVGQTASAQKGRPGLRTGGAGGN